MAQHLEYDPSDEDLTVAINSPRGCCHSEVRASCLLLKMFSPWWKSRLSSSFQDCGPSANDRVIHITVGEPDVAALALRAARLALSVDDLVKLGDLQATFKLWQLADMWQFGYLVELCQRALRVQLRGKDPTEMQQLLRPALEHSQDFLQEVLKPFFKEHVEERSPEVYLGLGGAAPLQLAQAAPIPGFQSRCGFQQQLLQLSHEHMTEKEVLEYLEQNVEARSKDFYATRSADACIRLFASAPLPRVYDMLSLVLASRWNRSQKTRALKAVNLGRLLTSDVTFLKQHHMQLPQEANMYRALWQASMRFAQHTHASHSLAAPWTFHFHNLKYQSNISSIKSGPVQLEFTHTTTFDLEVRFTTARKAYGLLLDYREHSMPHGPRIYQAGVAFAITSTDILLIIFENGSDTASA